MKKLLVTKKNGQKSANSGKNKFYIDITILKFTEAKNTCSNTSLTSFFSFFYFVSFKYFYCKTKQRKKNKQLKFYHSNLINAHQHFFSQKIGFILDLYTYWIWKKKQNKNKCRTSPPFMYITTQKHFIL